MFHDAIAVPLATGECQKDVEDGRCKRLDGVCRGHASIMSVTDIIVKRRVRKVIKRKCLAVIARHLR